MRSLVQIQVGPLTLRKCRYFLGESMAVALVDIDAQACAKVMRRYGFRTKQEAVNYALRLVAAEPAPHEHASLEEARSMRGMGWEGDLKSMRAFTRNPPLS